MWCVVGGVVVEGTKAIVETGFSAFHRPGSGTKCGAGSDENAKGRSGAGHAGAGAARCTTHARGTQADPSLATLVEVNSQRHLRPHLPWPPPRHTTEPITPITTGCHHQRARAWCYVTGVHYGRHGRGSSSTRRPSSEGFSWQPPRLQTALRRPPRPRSRAEAYKRAPKAEDKILHTHTYFWDRSFAIACMAIMTPAAQTAACADAARADHPQAKLGKRALIHSVSSHRAPRHTFETGRHSV